jgi:hypothetical protein
MPFELEPHPYFQYIKPKEPRDDREFVFLFGYIGNAEGKMVKLFPGLDLGICYEIPKEGIAYAEKACSVQETGPTLLVVDASTTINRVCNETRSDLRKVTAGFLSGAIVEANVWRARARHEAESRSMPTGETPSGVPLPLPLTYSTPACTHKGHCFCDPFYDCRK